MPRQYYRPNGIDGQPLDVVYYTENNKTVSVPFDNANTDFQEYLEWTKASPMNVAEPADEVTE